MTESRNELTGEELIVFESVAKLLAETGRDIFDEEIATDTDLRMSDVRAALLALAGTHLEVMPREDGSITVTGVVVG